MVHPFKLTKNETEITSELTSAQTQDVAGGSLLVMKPIYYTTLAHGEEGGMPEDPVM